MQIEPEREIDQTGYPVHKVIFLEIEFNSQTYYVLNRSEIHKKRVICTGALVTELFPRCYGMLEEIHHTLIK